MSDVLPNTAELLKQATEDELIALILMASVELGKRRKIIGGII